MEKISIDNYEAFFLDYHEGTLSPEQVADLLIFLEEHPELKERLEEFELINLSPAEDEIVFPDKEKLKQEIRFNTPEMMISSLEGLLSEKDQQLFNEALEKYPALKKEYRYYKLTKLEPDLSITYPYKQELYRRKKRIIWLPQYTWIAAAASIALLLMIWMLNRNAGKNTVMPDIAIHPSENNNHPPVKQVPGNTPSPENNAAAVPNETAKSFIHPGNNNKSIRRGSLIPEEIIRPKESPETLALNEIPIKAPALTEANAGETEFTTAAVSQNTDNTSAENKSPDGFVSLSEYAEARLLGENMSAARKHKTHPGWDLAKAAVRGFNRVTGSKIKIKENYENNGELVSYALNGAGLKYEHNTNKE